MTALRQPRGRDFANVRFPPFPVAIAASEIDPLRTRGARGMRHNMAEGLTVQFTPEEDFGLGEVASSAAAASVGG